MERRKFLLGISGATVASSSGCVGSIGERLGQSNGGIGTKTEGTGGANGEIQMKLSLISTDTGPGPLSYDVTVTNGVLSNTAIPNLEIAVKNTSDETVSWSYTGQNSNLPFPQGIHTKAETLVIGLDEEIQSQLMEVKSGCARVDGFVGADGIKNTTLNPGQRRKQQYAVVGVNGEMSEGCPKARKYRFEEKIGELGTWGFDFQLE